MADFEQSLNFNYAKITDNEKAIDEIRKENCDLRDVIDGLVVKLKQTRSNLEQVRKRQDDSERRSREWVICIDGVAEKPKEDNWAVLCDIISKNKHAGVTSPDMPLKSLNIVIASAPTQRRRLAPSLQTCIRVLCVTKSSKTLGS